MKRFSVSYRDGEITAIVDVEDNEDSATACNKFLEGKIVGQPEVDYSLMHPDMVEAELEENIPDDNEESEPAETEPVESEPTE